MTGQMTRVTNAPLHSFGARLDVNNLVIVLTNAYVALREKIMVEISTKTLSEPLRFSLAVPWEYSGSQCGWGHGWP
jgi:hypothetical protein